MGFLAHIREALLNLLSAKLRSLLAILGVLVGTASVVALISSSQLATAHALSQFTKLGTNLLAIMLSDTPHQKTQKKNLTLTDIESFQKTTPEIEKIAPYTLLFLPLRFKDKTFSGQVLGANESLSDIVKIQIQEGRFVSFLDNYSFFCVVGYDIGKQIQDMGINPIGQQINIGTYLFTIVGMMAPWQPNLFLFANLNQGVIIPFSLSFMLERNVEIQNILLQIGPNIPLGPVKVKLTSAINVLAPNKQIHFQDPQQIIDIVTNQRKTFSWLLSAIGGISLLVGGIGVMNIMLVSVIERRREIGVRMAVGARRKDILEMFLIESVVLTAFGGLLGVMAGSATTFLLAVFSRWEYAFHWLPILLGFLVSVAVGIFSGLYPSYRASRLDPITMLQSE